MTETIPAARSRPNCSRHRQATRKPRKTKKERCRKNSRPDKTQLLGDDDEYGIAYRLRKIAEFAGGLPVSRSPQTAGTDGDKRLIDVKTRPLDVGGGIHKRRHSLKAVGRDKNQRQKPGRSQQEQTGNVAQLGAAEKINDSPRKQNNYDGAG